MSHYILIKSYPGSPPLGTIVSYDRDTDLYLSEEDYYVNPEQISSYPEFWEQIDDPSDLIIEHVKNLVKMEVFRSGNGGQHVNKMDTSMKLSCEEFQLSIECGYYRSVLQNRNVCLKLFQIFLNNLDNSTKQYYIDLWKENNTPTIKK